MLYTEPQVHELLEDYTNNPHLEKYKKLVNLAYAEVPWSCKEFEVLILPVLNNDYLFDLIRNFPKQTKMKPSKLNINSEKESNISYDYIPQIYVLIKYYSVHKNWHILTSFILNLFNDHQMTYKIISCRLFLELINHMTLSNTGLQDLFIDSLYVCLTYLPSSITVEDPSELLDVAYKALLQIEVDLIELLNKNLMSIDKVFNRFGESTSILSLQLHYLLKIVRLLGPEILISFNRVNFLINQILINPYISETVIHQCLEIQRQVLTTFESEDSQGKDLIYQYRFDFIGAWKIMQSHHSFNADVNFQHLQKISADLGKSVEVLL